METWSRCCKTREDLPDGEGWAIERINLSTHNGTHLDAPWHYASTMDRGKPAATIDEIPLDWCYRPGVKLDFRSLPDGHVVSAAEVEAELGGSATSWSHWTSSS